MVLRATGAGQSGFICHDAEFFFNFVLQGSAALSCGDDKRWQVSAGDSLVIPRDTRFEIGENSSDLELLQVVLPGDVAFSRG
jgi:mannose-6-phosphate isomerase-like protein (cupin superfamily)